MVSNGVHPDEMVPKKLTSSAKLDKISVDNKNCWMACPADRTEMTSEEGWGGGTKTFPGLLTKVPLGTSSSKRQVAVRTKMTRVPRSTCAALMALTGLSSIGAA